MKVINYTKDLKLDNLVATIGAYDGIHQGHKKIFTVLNNTGNYKKAIITFNIHPDIALHKSNNDGVLNTLNEKIEIFKKYNIDYLIIFDILSNEFNVLTLDPYSFNKLLKNLGVKKVVVGEDFVYGLNKSGNIKTLNEDFEVVSVPLVKPDNYIQTNDKLSSNKIREYLKNGDLEGLFGYTGEYFKICERVTEGKKLGSKLGFPTANIPLKYTKMKFGVYYVKVQIDGKIYNGVANVGNNPTTDVDIKPLVEVNIFDFNKDIYHKEIIVSFIEYIRTQIKFENLNSLKEQINKDVNYIKQKYNI